MNQGAYQRGFVKAAMANRLNLLEAVNLLKVAESSGIGRYFAEKAIPSQAILDNPMSGGVGAGIS